MKKLIASVKRITQSLAAAADMPADKMPVVTVLDESASALYNQPAIRRSVVRVLGSALAGSTVRDAA